MGMYSKLTILSCCAAIGLAISAPSHADERACPTSSPPPVAVPAIKKRLTSNKEVLIVALGSSSTEGWRATTPANTYPARLQSDLGVAYPLAHFAVINRGIGGEDALEEMGRMDKDVISLRPDLVIWQVGANGAMAHSDPAVFRKLVSTGIERLKALNIDVVLMDNQRSPNILASPEHLVLERILSELAVQYRVSLFSRGALMDGWKREGANYDQFLSDDSVHMNDLGYHCTADALSSAIVAGLHAPDPPAIAKTTTPAVSSPASANPASGNPVANPTVHASK